MGQHTYGGGSLGEGHRLEPVSKTVTQQPRPQLERQISAGQRARRELHDHTGLVGAAGLGTAAAGAGFSSSGKRKLKWMDHEVAGARGRVSEAASAVSSHQANAHLAERDRAKALTEHANARSRQAALGQWENSSRDLPHTTRIKSSTGRETPTTISKVPSRAHATVRNALNRQAHDSSENAKTLGLKETAERARLEQARGDHSRFSAGLNRVEAVQRTRTPRLKARIKAGRGLMAAGGLVAGAAAVAAERKRVNKSLTQMKGDL